MKKMKTFLAIAAAILAVGACITVGVLLISGCMIAGGAFPEKDARAFLERHGYNPELVETVVTCGALTHQQIVTFSKSASADVRFLVAKNPNLTHEEIDLFMKDKNDYARSGAAWNPNLSGEQIEKLFRDPSHTVYCGLARNPAVPADTLMRLHQQRNPGLVYFAMNPKCPDAIKEEIRRSNDAMAKHWLTTVEQWNRDKKANGTNNVSDSKP